MLHVCIDMYSHIRAFLVEKFGQKCLKLLLLMHRKPVFYLCEKSDSIFFCSLSVVCLWFFCSLSVVFMWCDFNSIVVLSFKLHLKQMLNAVWDNCGDERFIHVKNYKVCELLSYCFSQIDVSPFPPPPPCSPPSGCCDFFSSPVVVTVCLS